MSRVAERPRVEKVAITLGPHLVRHASDEFTRARLCADLHSIAIDMVGRCEHDELSEEDKAFLHRAMASTVEAVAEELLDHMELLLAERLRETPVELSHRLNRATARTDLGID